MDFCWGRRPSLFIPRICASPFFAVKMCRFTYHTLSFFCSFLLIGEAQGANFSIDPSTSFPTKISVSQPVNVSWIWQGLRDEIFAIKLMYPGLDPFTITAGIPTTTPSPGTAKGTVIISAPKPGTATFLAVEDSSHSHTTMFSTLVVVQTAAPTGSSAFLSSSRTEIATPVSSATDTTSSTSDEGASRIQNHRSIIIGSVTGGVVILLLVLLGVFLHRRRARKQPCEGFRRDMMVLKTAKAGKPRREKAQEGNRNMDANSSNTPLQDDFGGDQNNRSSVSMSTYSPTSTATRTQAASAVSFSTTSSQGTSGIPILPLVSLTPPLSPFHLRSPSRARTDREMQIEQKIIELQGMFITAIGTGEEKNRTRSELKDRIEKVKDLRESEWAFGGEGQVPDILID
ncbi:hypothetical protein PM082_009590 [Marasmius tenuissimus]|nr:hypothetical protein PM082_009590 [Marasmius tenuissimus]